jgi:hypothetical protein
MDDETRKFKQILICLILFVVSAYLSYSELKFMVFGKTIDASVVRAVEAPALGRRSRPSLMVEYQFQDTNGATRKEADNVALDWKVEGATVPVQYIPGSPGSSRLVGHTQYFFVILFVAALAVLAFVGIRFWKSYKEYERASRRS